MSNVTEETIPKETKSTDMMMTWATRKLEVYGLEISDLSGKFTLNSKVFKVEINILFSLSNPKYKEIIKQRQHLQGINKRDCDTKPDLPINMVLGASCYARIKMQEIATGRWPEEPVAELTQYWRGCYVSRESDRFKQSNAIKNICW